MNRLTKADPGAPHERFVSGCWLSRLLVWSRGTCRRSHHSRRHDLIAWTSLDSWSWAACCPISATSWSRIVVALVRLDLGVGLNRYSLQWTETWNLGPEQAHTAMCCMIVTGPAVSHSLLCTGDALVPPECLTRRPKGIDADLQYPACEHREQCLMLPPVWKEDSAQMVVVWAPQALPWN